MNGFKNTKERISLARDGNENILSELVVENTPLVKSIAKRFIDRGVEFEDLVQIGMIGLIKAIRAFDFSYDTTLSTYAVPVIHGEIKRYIRDDGIIKISRETKTTAVKVKHFISEYEKKNGTQPRISEICNALDVSEEEIVFCLEATQPLSSLTIEADDGDEFEIPIGVDEIEEKIDKFALNEAIEKLSAEEKELIKLRYFRGLTQSQTAKILNVSQVKVSRYEKRICNKLKSLLE